MKDIYYLIIIIGIKYSMYVNELKISEKMKKLLKLFFLLHCEFKI